MGRFRPRGSQTQRIIGKAVGKGLNEYNRNKGKSSNSNSINNPGCIVVVVCIMLFLLLVANC